MLKILPDEGECGDLATGLDGLVAEGARRMWLAGLEAEVAQYIDRHREFVDDEGHRLVVPTVKQKNGVW